MYRYSFSFLRYFIVVLVLTVLGLAVLRPGSYAQLSPNLTMAIPTVNILGTKVAALKAKARLCHIL